MKNALSILLILSFLIPGLCIAQKPDSLSVVQKLAELDQTVNDLAATVLMLSRHVGELHTRAAIGDSLDAVQMQLLDELVSFANGLDARVTTAQQTLNVQSAYVMGKGGAPYEEIKSFVLAPRRHKNAYVAYANAGNRNDFLAAAAELERLLTPVPMTEAAPPESEHTVEPVARLP